MYHLTTHSNGSRLYSARQTHVACCRTADDVTTQLQESCAARPDVLSSKGIHCEKRSVRWRLWRQREVVMAGWRRRSTARDGRCRRSWFLFRLASHHSSHRIPTPPPISPSPHPHAAQAARSTHLDPGDHPSCANARRVNPTPLLHHHSATGSRVVYSLHTPHRHSSPPPLENQSRHYIPGTL